MILKGCLYASLMKGGTCRVAHLTCSPTTDDYNLLWLLSDIRCFAHDDVLSPLTLLTPSIGRDSQQDDSVEKSTDL